MTDHSHYEELAALSAGGFLSGEEWLELRSHCSGCNECRHSEQEFRELVRLGLPLMRGRLLDFVDATNTRGTPELRKRFLSRATLEGIRFTAAVEKDAPVGWRLRLAPVGAIALIAVTLVAGIYGAYSFRRLRSLQSVQPEQQNAGLQEEVSSLNLAVSQKDETLAKQRQEIQDLRSQLEKAKAAPRGQTQSGGENAQLLGELENREKQLTAATEEISRINQLRATDQASLVEQQYRINQISDELRIAKSTLDMERQLASAGQDIRELMLAHQLHVIDVRDTGPNGKPGEAFGRVFLAEGKSLTLYAFDLDEGRTLNAKSRFEVWGEQEAKKNSAQSLGMLYVDDKADRRWSLKLTDPELLNKIDSIFITAVLPGAGNRPVGQHLLFTYLGRSSNPSRTDVVVPDPGLLRQRAG